MSRPTTSALAAALLLSLTACKGAAHEAHESALAHPPATSLAAGIAAAEKSEPGLKFLAAELESEGGKVICSVLFAKGGAAREINVDASNGSIASSEDEPLGAGSQVVLKSAGGASASVAQALEAALRKVPGTWAREVRLANEGGALVYEVTLAGGKEPLRAQVSASDASVKKVSELEEEEGEEGEEHEKH
jgi:uncharacterized membrane protein YkoI